MWLENQQYGNLCNYFKAHGATTLREFKAFFDHYHLNELCIEFPELSKLLLFTLKSLLISLSDDDFYSYKVNTNNSGNNNNNNNSNNNNNNTNNTKLLQ